MRAWEGRRAPRLVGYDYSQPGLYFVTLCTFNRAATLGEIVAGEVQLSRAGAVVLEAWQRLPARFPGLELDAFVIMPNHVHGIVFLGSDPTASTLEPPDLNRVLRAFKSASGLGSNQTLGRAGQPFWQRSYHDRIVRNEHELALTRAYIANNPANWELDTDNPVAAPPRPPHARSDRAGPS